MVVLSDNVGHDAPVVTVTIGSVVVVVAVDAYTPKYSISERRLEINILSGSHPIPWQV